ncbi:hypothetical protein WMQ43_23005, partial [Vibrio diabolicus]|uniref:hypothetical protein n=1 Tax=Vibrio diabolicus TaxID=50719 RepID=UPI0037511625
ALCSKRKIELGYKLTSLANLPLSEKVDMYVFLIGGDQWQGGIDEIVKTNFDKLATDIGANSVIVGALTEDFHGQVVDKYLGQKCEELIESLPALLLTDTHPDNLSEDSMRLLLPLAKVQDVYPVVNNFLTDLASFARGESDSLLKALEQQVNASDIANDVVKFNLPVIPGFVSVNLNSTVTHLRTWWNTTR